MIREEKAVYGQISDEEWEAIRPTKRERKDTILNFMRGFLKENSKCSNCTTWRMQSGESWGNVYDTRFSSICKYIYILRIGNVSPYIADELDKPSFIHLKITTINHRFCNLNDYYTQPLIAP